jgi:hypothetical protein
MLVGGGRRRGRRPGALSAVVRVRLGGERGGRGEIGPWGDEREGGVGEHGTRGRPSCLAVAVVFRRSG